MAKKDKIVADIVKMLAIGQNRSEIMAKIVQECPMSERTFTRYHSKASEIHRETQNKVIKAVADIRVAETIEAVKQGLKTDLEIEEQLLKIGFGEIDVVETTDTPNGRIINERKPTPAEMRGALMEVWKKRGTYAAEKQEITVAKPVIINWTKKPQS